MRRRLPTILPAIVLALCLATVALWVRSYSTYDAVAHEANGYAPGTGILSVQGKLVAYHFGFTGPNPPTAQWNCVPGGTNLAGKYDFSAYPHVWNRLGFVIQRRALTGPITPWDTASVPHWFVAGTLLMLAVFLRVRMHGSEHNDANACRVCSYDLRATPDRCPECGTVTTSVSVAPPFSEREHKQ